MAPTPANVAILLAGGVGERVGLDIPKQLIKIGGRTILEHTLFALNSHPQVDEIIIMMAPGHLDAVHEILRPGGYTKVTKFLEGPATRNAPRSWRSRVSETMTARCCCTTPYARWSVPASSASASTRWTGTVSYTHLTL